MNTVDPKLTMMVQSFVQYAKDINSAEIEDMEVRAAYRVLRNCIDVMCGLAIPEIKEVIKSTSVKLGETHLLFNNLTPAQRGLLESWVFETNGK